MDYYQSQQRSIHPSYSENQQHRCYQPHHSNQQLYYQDQECLPPPSPWQPQNNHNSEQYRHQQLFYHSQQPQSQYLPITYHHQQQQHSDSQPSIHQLNTLVNNERNPISPTPVVRNCISPVYSSSSTKPTSTFVLQTPASASASPNNSLSPIHHPVTESSPGAISNHMMPVRLQNMAKGARTKAGMRKLMQMQEQNCSAQLQRRVNSPEFFHSPDSVNLKKSRGKKNSTMFDICLDSSSSLNSTADSIDEAIDAALVNSPIFTVARLSPPTPVPLGECKAKPNVSSFPKKAKLNETYKTDEPQPIPKRKKGRPRNSVNPTIVPIIAAHEQPQLLMSRPIEGNQRSISISGKSISVDTQSQMPSDLLFEKLGLSIETSEKRLPKDTSSPSQLKKPAPTAKSGILEDAHDYQYEFLTGKKSFLTRETPNAQSNCSNAFVSGTVKDKSLKLSPSLKQKLPPAKFFGIKSANSQSAEVTPVARSSNTTLKQISSGSKNMFGSSFTSNDRKEVESSNQLKNYGIKSKAEPCSDHANYASIAAVAASIIPGVSVADISSNIITNIPSEKKKRKYVRKVPLKSKAFQSRKTASKDVPQSSPHQHQHNDKHANSVSVKIISPNNALSGPNHFSPPRKAREDSAKSFFQTVLKIPDTKNPKRIRIRPSQKPKAKAAVPCSPSEEFSVTLAAMLDVKADKNAFPIKNGKGSIEVKNMKRSTVLGKSSSHPLHPGSESKKEPGPSLKVKRGVVKFYRGSTEEDVDESFKKLDAVLKDNVSKEYGSKQAPWICIFCSLGPHDMRLGDLFGPYFVEEFCERNPIDKPQAVAKKEVWVHADCALWAGNVILVGCTLRNLDETLLQAKKVICNICRNVGATIGCRKRGCLETAHFPCAKLNNWSLNGETFHSHCRAHFCQL